MALNVSNINYSGKEIASLIIKDTLDSSLLHTKFGCRIIPAFKSKFVWHDTTIDLTINDGSPTCPTFNTDATLNQNNGELCAYHVAGKIPHDALIETYRELQYAQGVLKERVSDDTELFSALMAMIYETTRQKQDVKYMEDNYLYQCQNGLRLQFEDDEFTATNAINRPVPAGQKLTAVAITSTNVQAELSRLITALPGKYKYGELSSQFGRPKFAVSYAIMDAYLQSLTYTAPTAALGLGVENPQLFSYRGFELVPIAFLADNEMFLTPGDNIAIVFDAQDDITNLLVRDGLEDATLCKEISFRLDYRTAIFFGDGNAIVWYR